MSVVSLLIRENKKSNSTTIENLIIFSKGIFYIKKMPEYVHQLTGINIIA